MFYLLLKPAALFLALPLPVIPEGPLLHLNLCLRGDDIAKSIHRDVVGVPTPILVSKRETLLGGMVVLEEVGHCGDRL